ncbi:MAG: translation initiation factor IF-1 [Tenericutes bacterium]|nr:translation initiation factor IF-1 [Bacilli bacterium]MDD4623871.1 translation initiation factor IF-1 [Bacilli bacterium]MDD4831279.1 translation initiation factor IF-1 [Bacilli bacterium]NLV90402.1 translation initiation factor IF-1 [Mycoplasmatota bacterium]
MSNKDSIEMNGKVLDLLPSGQFKVELENGHIVTAYIGGKMRMNFIRVQRGDNVKIELSPFDLTHGRIIFRN